jgi:tetratricopeptide (TPR) repeat protein
MEMYGPGSPDPGRAGQAPGELRPEEAIELLKASASTVRGPERAAPRPSRRVPGREAGKRVPSGGRLFLIAGGSTIAAGIAAAAVLTLWKPAFVPGAPGPRDADQAALDAERRIAALEEGLERFRGENAELGKVKDDLLDENQALAEQLDECNRRSRELRETVRRRTEAAHLMLAAVQLLERRTCLERALGMVTAALEREPTFADAHRVKGLALAALGRPEEALGALEAAHEAARRAGLPGDIEALVLAGEICLTDLGCRDRALACYKRSASLDGDSPLGLAAEARVLFLQGKLDDAELRARQAREADGSLALAPLILGETALRRALLEPGADSARHLKIASELLAEAARLDPNSARACLLRGRVLLEESRLAERRERFGIRRLDCAARAERLLLKASGLSPRLPEPYVALASLRLEHGAFRDPAEARDFALEAVRLTGRKDASALATLAAAHAAAGDPASAARAIEEALRAEPENDRLRSALREYEQRARAVTK